MAANIKYGIDDTPGDDVTEVLKPQSNVHGQATNDEESPLLSRSDSAEPRVKALAGVGTIIAVLLLGKVATLGILDVHSRLTMYRRVHLQCGCHTGHGRCWPHLLPI